MIEATPIGYSALEIGDTVKVISRDSFRGKIGAVDYITPDREYYQIRLVGRYGSDVVPFRRHEIMRYP